MNRVVRVGEIYSLSCRSIAYRWKQRDVRYCEAEPGRGEKLPLGWRISVSSLWEPTLWQSKLIRLKIQLYPRVVHQIMLVEHGVHLIENLLLDELVRDKIYEFFSVLATPKLKGGSAFPAEPVAII